MLHNWPSPGKVCENSFNPHVQLRKPRNLREVETSGERSLVPREPRVYLIIYVRVRIERQPVPQLRDAVGKVELSPTVTWVGWASWRTGRRCGEHGLQKIMSCEWNSVATHKDGGAEPQFQVGSRLETEFLSRNERLIPERLRPRTDEIRIRTAHPVLASKPPENVIELYGSQSTEDARESGWHHAVDLEHCDGSCICTEQH